MYSTWTKLACSTSSCLTRRSRARPKPLAWRNVKQLPVVYRSSAKAWMTSELFKEYVMWFDGEVSRMFKDDDDKVLLLVDNCCLPTWWCTFSR